MKKLSLNLIVFYQKHLSLHLHTNCRFVPTCSEYTYQAIMKYGLVGGIARGTWRILRCNPFNRKYGYDPVKENYKGEARWVL